MSTHLTPDGRPSHGSRRAARRSARRVPARPCRSSSTGRGPLHRSTAAPRPSNRDGDGRSRAFVWVREEALLAETVLRISGFLQSARSQRPGTTGTELLGFWIANAPAGETPCSPSDLQDGDVRVTETVGLAGAWSLCWIEGAPTADQLERALRAADAHSGAGRFARVVERAAGERGATPPAMPPTMPAGTVVRDRATGRLTISA